MNRILALTMNPSPWLRGLRGWRGVAVVRIHRWRHGLRRDAWLAAPLSPAWERRRDVVRVRLTKGGTLAGKWSLSTRWLILAAERFADTLRLG